MIRYVYDECVFTFSVLSAYAYLLSLLAPLPSQIAQSYRYKYDDGYAHANADPYDFLVETTGRVPVARSTRIVYADTFAGHSSSDRHYRLPEDDRWSVTFENPYCDLPQPPPPPPND